MVRVRTPPGPLSGLEVAPMPRPVDSVPFPEKNFGGGAVPPQLR